MPDDFRLAMIEEVQGLYFALDLFGFECLAFDVLVELGDCFLNYRDLPNEEVGQVIVIGLCCQWARGRSGSFPWRRLASLQHLPVGLK